MPDPKIKAKALYKQMVGAYGPQGSISPGAFQLDEASFTDKIYNNPKYAEKIYGAMNAAYGDDGFKYDKKSFIRDLGYDDQSQSTAGPGKPTKKQSPLDAVIASGQTLQAPEPKTPGPMDSVEGLLNTMAPAEAERQKKEQESLAFGEQALLNPKSPVAPISMQPLTPDRQKNLIASQIGDPQLKYKDNLKNALHQIEEDEKRYLKTQAEADAYYETPQGKLYYQLVRPVMKTLTETGGGIAGFATRTAANALEGIGAEEASKSVNKIADNIVDYLSYDNAAKNDRPDAAQFAEPTKLKGNLNIHNVIPRTAETLTGIGTLLGGGEALGGGNLGLMASSYIQTNEAYRKAAKQAGLTDGEADAYAATSAGLTSMLMLGNPFKGALTGKLGESLAKTGQNSVLGAIKDGVSVNAAVKEGFKKYLNGLGHAEAFVIAQHLSDASVKYGFDKMVLDTPKFGQTSPLPDMHELAQSMALMGIATGVMVSPGIVKSSKPSSIERSSWATAAKDPELFNRTVDKGVEQGNVTPQQAEVIKQNVGEYKEIYDATKQHGLDDNTAARVALDAYRAKKMDEANKPISGISVLEPLKEQHEAQKTAIESDIKDAMKGIPEKGTEISSVELAERMKETGAANKVDQLVDRNYRVNDVRLKDLYEKNAEFKKYVDEEKLKPSEDEDGLRNPVIINADGKIVDGFNRLAQQYVDGEKVARAYIETKDINVQEPGEINKPRIVDTETASKGVTVERPVNKENIPLTEKLESNAIQEPSARKMDVRQQAGNGERVGIENPKSEVTSPESIKEEIAPQKAVNVPEPKLESPEGPRLDITPESKEMGIKEAPDAKRNAAIDRLKKAYSEFQHQGIISDVEKNFKRDKEFYSALANYVKEEIMYRINQIKGFADKTKSEMKRAITKSLRDEGMSVSDQAMINDAFEQAYAEAAKIPGLIKGEPADKVSYKKYIKDRILLREKATIEGIKQGKGDIRLQVREAKKAVFDVFKGQKIKPKLSQLKQIVSAFDKVARVKNKEKAVDYATDVATQIVWEAKNREIISSTKKLIKKVQALKKNKGMVKQDVDWISNTQFPDPSRVDDIPLYRDMLNEYNKSRRGEQTGMKYTKDEIAEFFDQENARIHSDKMKRLQGELDELKADGEIPDDVTLDEYIAMLDNRVPDKLKEFKSMKDEVLRKDLAEGLEAIKDRIPEFEGYEKDIIERLVEVDPKELSSIELRVLNNILNNIAEYGTLDRAGEIITAFEANKVVKDIIAINPKLRILPANPILNKSTLSNTTSSLFYNNNVIAEFRSKTFGPVEQAISKDVKIPANKYAEDFTKMYKKHNLTAISNKKLFQFSFLNQWRGMHEGMIADEFKKSVDKLVSDVKYHFERAQSLNKGENKISQKGVEDQLKALKELGLIDYDIVGKKLNVDIKNEIFDNGDPIGVINEIYNKLSAGEKEVYEYAVNKFEETVDGVENYARIHEGKGFERIPGGKYFPRIPVHKEKPIDSNKEDLDLNNAFSSNMKSLNKRPPRLMEERAKDFNDDVYYDSDFYTNAINGYWNSLYTSKAMPEVQKLDKILKNEDFKRFLNGKFDETFAKRDKVNREDKTRTLGEYNFDKFKKQLVTSLNEEKLSPFFSHNPRVLDEILNRSVKGVLGNIPQAPKQYITASVNNLIVNDAGAWWTAVGSHGKAIFDKEYRDARRKLLNNFTGVQRSVRGQSMYDKGYKSIDESKSWYQYPLDWQAKLQEISSIPLEKGDQMAQNEAYIASYITSLIKQGKIKNAGEFDIYKESQSPNKQAISYAEQIAGEINNESAKGYRPAIIKDPAGAAKYLWLLQSFNLNAYRFAKQKAQIAFGINNGATMAERQQALTHVIGFAAQIGAYNIVSSGIRAGYLMIGFSLLKALFGIEKKELSEEQKHQKHIKEKITTGANAFSDMFFGGQNAVTKLAIQNGINYLYKAWALNERMKKKESGEKFNNKGTYLNPKFAPYYSDNTLPGAAAFIYKLFEKGADLALDTKEAKKDPSNEEQAASMLSKYVAPPVTALGLGDFILFERAMETALRQNKTAEGAKKQSKPKKTIL